MTSKKYEVELDGILQNIFVTVNDFDKDNYKVVLGDITIGEWKIRWRWRYFTAVFTYGEHEYQLLLIRNWLPAPHSLVCDLYIDGVSIDTEKNIKESIDRFRKLSSLKSWVYLKLSIIEIVYRFVIFIIAGLVINTIGFLFGSNTLGEIITDSLFYAALFSILLQLFDFISMLINRRKISKTFEKHKEH